YWNQYWMGKMGSQEQFDLALQDGVIEPQSEPAMGGASFGGNIGEAITAIQSKKPAAGKELLVYQKVSMGHGGSWSNNPWLQEMPDPITKSTWDNYACVSPKTAFDLGAELTSITQVDLKKHVIAIET